MENNELNSDKLLKTDIMVLLGGRSNPNLIPPNIPNGFPNSGDWHNEPKLPELINSNVDDILSRPPSWLLKWGITIFFACFVGLFAISWYVQYPDIVSSSMKIVSNNLPKTITSKIDGQLTQLFVKDAQMVQEGDKLAYFESTAIHSEVLELESLINHLIEYSNKNEIEKILNFAIPNYYNLGELQKSFQIFQDALIKSEASKNTGINIQKQYAIKSEISSLRKMNENTTTQLEIQKKDLELAWAEAQNQQSLSEKGFVSKLEAKNALSRYLNKKQAYEQAKSSIENNKVSQTQKHQEILEVEKTIYDQKSSLIQAINTLKSDILAWKLKYIAYASTSGKINFHNNLQENLILKSGQELLSILPENSGFYGEMQMGQYNLGKVQIGQNVMVKFPSYPFQEFGFVNGKVSYISDLSKDSTYLIKVNFPQGLITSTKKSLPFKNGMLATGDIITQNLRLIERFFYEIRKTLKK